MSRRPDHALLAFEALTIEGGLLPAEWLGKIAALKAKHQAASDYGIPKGLNLRDELGRYWRIATAQWHDFDRARNHTDEPHAVTRRFVTTLLRDVFGFTDLAPEQAPVSIDERLYPLTAQAREGRVPLVVAAHNQRLEGRDIRFGDDGRQRSAFGLLQDYLNAAEPALWGLASNGCIVRLARDNASFTRPAWIEADLERIFGEERFADFSALWLLIHASRFGNAGDSRQACALETWHEASREEGMRARDKLRQTVHDALLDLGQGFLATPGNTELREKIGHTLTPTAYFQQLLRLVYRLIFLLTIEERGLLHPEDSAAETVELYRKGYSLHHLRERSRRRRAFDRHHDVWQGLKPVFTGLAHGQPLLALPALGGLFADDQCADLDAADLGNSALLSAIYRLTWMHEDGALVRINWRDMGPEEFGSVYESLLELVPDVSADGRRFDFADPTQAKGNQRKTTGSYYTPDVLVQELLDSALQPVIEQRLAAADDQEQALLAITVCDPACGSGHFLLAAARRMANQLARLRAQGTPSGDDFRHALRDVIGHCIYGVDMNPMALELARMSLWLEAMTPDKPLGFLDHHLQCGDALLGLADLAVLEQGIPKDAFKALSGDDKAVCKALSQQNSTELKNLKRRADAATTGGQYELATTRNHGLDALRALEAMPEASLDDIAAKQAAWQVFADQAVDSPLRHAADMYMAAFLLPKARATKAFTPTTGSVLMELAGQHGQPGHVTKREAARTACNDARVLHWPLAFPLVFAAEGFSCMLANPPWERIKLQEQEFFASRNRDIAQAKNKAERSQRIQWLAEGMLAAHLNPEEGRMDNVAAAEQRLYADFMHARRTAEATSVFAHVKGEDGGRYPLTGVGDVNTYALFAETISGLAAESGRAGFIVPTGIATDDSTKAFFGDITQRGRLISLYDFENRDKLFPAVDSRQKFCLLTLGAADEATFICFATQVAQLADARRRFTLAPNDFRLINPNTLTCPVFRTKRDAELTKKLYRAAPVLIDETRNDGNSWGIRFIAMFHMSNDSHLFAAAPDEGRLPLYEGKMVQAYDHRAASVVVNTGNSVRPGQPNETPHREHTDPNYSVKPQYWISKVDVDACLSEVWNHRWLATFKSVTSPSNERTFISCIVPYVGLSNSLIGLLPRASMRHMVALYANLNALVFDYVVRNKVGGVNLNFFLAAC